MTLRRRRVLAVLVVLCTMLMVLPTTDHLDPYDMSIDGSFLQAGIGDNIEHYVNSTSSLHDPTDKGTHDVFADLQAKDTTMDTMTEANQGGSGGSEWLSVNADDSTFTEWDSNAGVSPWLGAPSDGNYLWELTTSGEMRGWFDFPSTTLTGDLTVNVSGYVQNSDGTGNDHIDAYLDYVGGGGANVGSLDCTTSWTYYTFALTGTYTPTEVNAMRIYVQTVTVGQGDDMYIDHLRLGVSAPASDDYELDLEVQFTDVDYDETSGEELCVYGGTQAAEALKVDVWDGSWVNIIADVATDGWSNVSISSYLTSATIEFRFVDADQASDASGDTWDVDAMLIHSWTTSYTPVNDQTPTLDNPTDTNRMYAQYVEYQVTVYVSDQNGFADIDYLEWGIWDDTQTTEYFRFRYDEDTNTFTEEYDSGTIVSLNAGSSSATETGNDIDATFYFTVDWDFPDVSTVDSKCYVIDTQSETDTDWYESDWRIETRLDYSVAPAITGDDSGTIYRGDLEESFTFDGTLIYYESTDDNPASDQVDVWVSASLNSLAGPWSDLTLTSGAFSVTPVGDDVVGIDTYTVKPVIEAAGSGGTSLYYTTDLDDTYISDQAQVVTTTVDDPRVDTSANAEIRVTIKLLYDNEVVGSGDSVTLDNVAMSWDAVNTWWDLSRSQASVGLWKYFVNSSTEAGHGITGLDLNSQEQDMIWDSVTITITDPADQRQNINVNASGIIVTGVYDYDSTAFDGTFTMNNTQYSYTTAQKQGYTVSSVSGDTHGITEISTNDVTYFIWDRLIINTQADDETPQNGIQVTFTLTVTFEYDSVECTTYQIVIVRNATWWHSFTNSNKSLFVDTNSDVTYLYNASIVTSESLHGITAFSTNTETVVWSAAANNVPVNDTSPTISNADDGDHLFAKYRYYFITSYVSDADTYTDITYVELSIWDNARGTEYIRVRYTVSGSSFSVELGAAYITLQYSSVVESGNDIDITWSIKVDWDFPDLADLDTEQYVIDSATDSDTDWYESNWEIETQLDYSVSPYLSDDRGNINTANLQSDGTVIFFGSSGFYPLSNETDVWVLHDVSGIWSGDIGGAGAFTISSIGSSASVRLNTYTFKVVAQGDGSGGTDLYYSTSLTDTFITDSVTISITDPDQRININVNASGIVVTGVYDYDSETFDGTFTLNDTTFSFASVGKRGYTVSSISGDGFGVTEINTNDETYCIWDSLTAYITPPTESDQRININTNASGMVVWAIYDYDSTTFDGTLNLNDTDFSHSIVGKYGYKVSAGAGDDAHGITVVSTANATYMIFDRLIFDIQADLETPENGQQVNFTLTVTFDYDDTACTTYEITISRSSIHWHSFINANKSLFNDTNIDITYAYTSSGVNSESTYGITAFTTDTVTVEWSDAVDGPYVVPIPTPTPTPTTSPSGGRIIISAPEWFLVALMGFAVVALIGNFIVRKVRENKEEEFYSAAGRFKRRVMSPLDRIRKFLGELFS